MSARQAPFRLWPGLVFLAWFLLACVPLFHPRASTSTPAPAGLFTPQPTSGPVSLPVVLPSLTPPIVASPTPRSCLQQPGQLVTGEVPTPIRPTAFLVYLPPCYDESPDQRYPVLYLLHGQTYTADQWVRLGAPATADRLIGDGVISPFIMVFPEDRYWNLEVGLRFGQYLLNEVMPHVEQRFPIRAERPFRAIGGLSRGGGWAFQLGLTHPELFASIGLHSPAIFDVDRLTFKQRLQRIPPDLRPRIYLDIGENDRERNFALLLEQALTRYEWTHEWHLNSGAHDEPYWRAQVESYLLWYAAGWR